MVENMIALVIGILLLFLGLMNLRGNISTTHQHKRTHDKKEKKGKYNKLMGCASLIMGLGIIIPAILRIIFQSEYLDAITLVTSIISLALICYAQFKRSKGLL